MVLTDARDYQILFLSLFLSLGVVTRDWSLQPLAIAIVISTCLITQAIAVWLSARQPLNSFARSSLKQPNFNWRSPLITALGLCLLLRVDQPWTMALAGSAAIASKFLFRVQQKHWFNPANFGIIVVLLLTGNAWVSPGQWGDDIWLGLVFLGAGGLVLRKVGRWDTSLAFLVSYASLEAMRNLWLGWTWDVWLHRLTSGSLLVFALFMVTDPRSIPNRRLARLLWASCIALLTFVLQHQFFLSTAMFWSLFAIAPLTIVFDRIWPDRPFAWDQSVAAIPADPEVSAASKTQPLLKNASA
ncbi:MAG: RnfABCDGE type electron transport complex subunit D [Cyanobacteria bacterium P01_H01_bin.121]